MPQITWQRLCKDTEILHLIVGALPPARVKTRDTYREELIGRLVAALKPRGQWAMKAVGEGESIEAATEVHLAFGQRSDAERVAVVTEARATGRYAGWASQRRFTLDRAAEARFVRIVGST